MASMNPSINWHSKKSSLAVYALLGIVIALMAGSAYLLVQVEGVRQEAQELRKSLAAEISSFRQRAEAASAAQRGRLDELRGELQAARRQSVLAAGQAKQEAQQHADRLAKAIALEQRRQQEQVTGELSSVKAVATAANYRIGEVSTDVSNVKTEVAATQSELEKTIADLKRTTGDLGVMSGLIATNARELAALKELGERNYFEFSLRKSSRPQRVGDIVVALKRTDVKRNKYTIDLIADDRKIEKKDKNTNEPVQFYLSKARQPYELVVNEIRKDQISGYLAAPKRIELARN
jgi:hypothetical protein